MRKFLCLLVIVICRHRRRDTAVSGGATLRSTTFPLRQRFSGFLLLLLPRPNGVFFSYQNPSVVCTRCLLSLYDTACIMMATSSPQLIDAPHLRMLTIGT